MSFVGRIPHDVLSNLSLVSLRVGRFLPDGEKNGFYRGKKRPGKNTFCLAKTLLNFLNFSGFIKHFLCAYFIFMFTMEKTDLAKILLLGKSIFLPGKNSFCHVN